MQKNLLLVFALFVSFSVFSQTDIGYGACTCYCGAPNPVTGRVGDYSTYGDSNCSGNCPAYEAFDISSWSMVAQPSGSAPFVNPSIGTSSHPDCYQSYIYTYNVVGFYEVTFSSSFGDCDGNSISTGMCASFNILPPLPIKLGDFTVTRQGISNQLFWNTKQEINSDYFLVERSGDGEKFEESGHVEAAKNSNEIKEYRFEDNSPYQQTYYRLKMVDLDGTHEYSDIIQIGSTGTVLAALYPNPSSGMLNIASDVAQKLSLQMFDTNGKLIFIQRYEAENNFLKKEVNIEGLPSGVYTYKITDLRTGKSLNGKFVKE